MSANLATVPAPRLSIEQARAALDAVQAELAALDERLALHQRDADENDLKTQQHRVAKTKAVSAGLPTPKAPKLKVIDADVVPILRGKRKEIAERLAEAEGKLRRTYIKEVTRRYAQATDAFAHRASALVTAWREMVGAKALLDASGAGGFAQPLPDVLYTDFALPALGALRPICENHRDHFLASHAIAQGELQRAARQARADIERDLQMTLPW